MNGIETELIELKDAALAATKRADGDFYAGYLHDDAIAITPHGIFDKAAIVAQMSLPASSFASDSVDDVRAIPLSDSSGVVTYRASYPSGDVMVTTVYRRDEAGWKGLLYQQTPLPA
jgi:hypothetical protein